MNMIRINILMERLISTLDGDFNSQYASDMKKAWTAPLMTVEGEANRNTDGRVHH
jgi:hypothetical protein